MASYVDLHKPAPQPKKELADHEVFNNALMRAQAAGEKPSAELFAKIDSEYKKKKEKKAAVKAGFLFEPPESLRRAMAEREAKLNDLSTAAQIAGWGGPTAIGAGLGALTAPKNKGIQSTLRGAGLGAALHAGTSLGARAGSALGGDSPTGALLGAGVGGLGSTLAAQYLLPRVDDDENNKKEKEKKAGSGYGGNASVNSQHYSPQMSKRKLTEDEQSAVSEGENRWLPTMFQNYGTPVSEMMASPLKMSLLTGVPVGLIVAGLAARGNMSPTAAAQPALTGLAAGLGGGLGMYWHQQSRNTGLKELMTRLPEGATKRDLLADPAYQADLDRKNNLMAARMPQNTGRRAGPFGKFSAELQKEKEAMSLYSFGAKIAQSACSPCAMPNAPTNKKPYTSESPAVTDASQASKEIGKPPVTETEHSAAKAKLPEEGAKSAFAFGMKVAAGFEGVTGVPYSPQSLSAPSSYADVVDDMRANQFAPRGAKNTAPRLSTDTGRLVAKQQHLNKLQTELNNAPRTDIGPRNMADTVIDSVANAPGKVMNYGGPRNTLDTVIDATVAAPGKALTFLNNARLSAGRQLGEMWAAGGDDGGRGYQGPPGSTPQVSGKVGPKPDAPAAAGAGTGAAGGGMMDYLTNPYVVGGGLGALGLGGLLYHLNSQPKKKKRDEEEV